MTQKEEMGFFGTFQNPDVSTRTVFDFPRKILKATLMPLPTDC